MSFIGDMERTEFMEQVDAFFMARQVFEEKLTMEPIRHNDAYPGEIFLMALLTLQEKYPYFTIRPPKKNIEYFTVITVSLPRKLKAYYGETKRRLAEAFDDIEHCFSEVEVHNHYNQLHIELQSTTFFHEVLDSMIRVFKDLKAKEVA